MSGKQVAVRRCDGAHSYGRIRHQRVQGPRDQVAGDIE